MEPFILKNREGALVDLDTEKVWELIKLKEIGVAYVEVKESKEHYHDRTHEIYIVVDGDGKLILDGEEIQLEKDMVVYIPPGKPHKIKNGTPLRMYVISNPEWSEEDHHLIE